jgi:hypothetical protein
MATTMTHPQRPSQHGPENADAEIRSAVSYIFTQEMITPEQLLGILSDLVDTWTRDRQTPGQIGDSDCQSASAKVQVAIEQIFAKHQIEPQELLTILDELVERWGGNQEAAEQQPPR